MPASEAVPSSFLMLIRSPCCAPDVQAVPNSATTASGEHTAYVTGWHWPFFWAVTCVIPRFRTSRWKDSDVAAQKAGFAHTRAVGMWLSASPRVQRLAAVQVAVLLGAALIAVAVHRGPVAGG